VMLLERHRSALIDFAIRPEILEQAGVLSVEQASDLPDNVDDYWKNRLPALLYPWSMNGHSTWQLAPDDRSNGPKYVFPEGSEPTLNQFRDRGDGPVLLVEGTKQHLSAASYAPDEFAIYGMFGCWGWSKTDLSFAKGRPVWVILDGDVKTNRDVYDAAASLKEALELVGADRILFAKIPGDDGLDDLLARSPDELRTDILIRLLERAEEKLGRAPAKKSQGSGSDWFSDNGSLLAMTVAKALFEHFPMVLTRENQVALYRRGAYRMDPMAFMGVLVDLLKEDYRPAYRATVEEVVCGVLTLEGRVLPDRLDEPLMNVANGLVDLRTGELLDHDPDLLTSLQLPVVYDPDAICPTFDAWADEIVGDQLLALEEAASSMLDPSLTPQKALLLFGPARSGKSTYLRLLEAIAGRDNTTGVTLHQLSEDHFAAANVYGKILNIAADLSARHVEDISIFKTLTGEDLIRGNRKYGKDFHFRNTALFAFSANEIPTVGESSRAYSERIIPFKFGNSFAGRVDHTIEIRMRQELPGILNRLVRAWRQRQERGQDLPPNVAIRKEFELASDRVQQWVEEEMTVVTEFEGQAVVDGQYLPQAVSTVPKVLSEMFNRWADENHLAGMGRNKLVQRLTSRDDVRSVRQKVTGSRALNLIRRKSAGSSQALQADFPTEAPRRDTADMDKNTQIQATSSNETIIPSGHPKGQKGHPPIPSSPATGYVRKNLPEVPTTAYEENTCPPPSAPPEDTSSSASSSTTGVRPLSATRSVADADPASASPPVTPSGDEPVTEPGSDPAASPTTDNVPDRSNDHAELRKGQQGDPDGEDLPSTSDYSDEAEPDRPGILFGEGDPWL
jgi:putative DNA primase/helicase